MKLESDTVWHFSLIINWNCQSSNQSVNWSFHLVVVCSLYIPVAFYAVAEQGNAHFSHAFVFTAVSWLQTAAPHSHYLVVVVFCLSFQCQVFKSCLTLPPCVCVVFCRCRSIRCMLCSSWPRWWAGTCWASVTTWASARWRASETPPPSPSPPPTASTPSQVTWAEITKLFLR